VKWWQKELGSSTTVLLVIKGLSSYGEVNQLKSQLPNEARGIQSLHQRYFGEGRLEMDVEFKVADGYGKGTLGYSFFGGTYFNNVEAWLPMSAIEQIANISAFKPGGALDIKLSNVKLDNNVVVSARGDVAWHGAEMTMLKPLVLGDLDIAFEPNEGGVKAVLTDQGGPLKAEGILQLNPDKSYEFNGAFGTRGNQKDLHAALTTMGRFDRDGKVKLSLKGNLEQFGF